MTTQAVLFDLDETLMVEETSNQQSFKTACQLAAAQRQVDPDQVYQALAQKSDALWQERQTERSSGDDPRRCRGLARSHRQTQSLRSKVAHLLTQQTR